MIALPSMRAELARRAEVSDVCRTCNGKKRSLQRKSSNPESADYRLFLWEKCEDCRGSGVRRDK